MDKGGLIRFTCDALVPALTLLMVQEPLLAPPMPWRQRIAFALPFFLRSFFAVGIAVALAEWGKWVVIWPTFPGFPSGHATMATACATCLILHRGWGWAWLALPLAALMPPALVLHNAHVWQEATGGVLLGLLVPLLIWNLSRRFAPSEPDPTLSSQPS